jgi:hypothetical protein
VELSSPESAVALRRLLAWVLDVAPSPVARRTMGEQFTVDEPTAVFASESQSTSGRVARAVFQATGVVVDAAPDSSRMLPSSEHTVSAIDLHTSGAAAGGGGVGGVGRSGSAAAAAPGSSPSSSSAVVAMAGPVTRNPAGPLTATVRPIAFAELGPGFQEALRRQLSDIDGIPPGLGAPTRHRTASEPPLPTRKN